MNDTCICDNVPKVWRLTGVTRTLRLRIFNPDGTPLDLTGRTVAVTIARDNSEFSYAPGFVIEGDDGNVVKFEWPADKQGAGDYTINVTTTDGSGNVDRVNWHGPTGIRLVDFSFMVRGEDALGVTSEANIGLDGTFTMNGTGMSAYDEWLAEGHTGTQEDFIAWLRQPAVDAASAAEAQMGQIQERADADHTRAGNDHTTAGQDHTRAGNDHTTAASDHGTAADDHTLAVSDHGTAADDHTTAGNDHTRAQADHGIAADDHATAGNDHTKAQSDHSTASADHTKAAQDSEQAASDHTRAGGDHDTAVADHAQAEADHTRAEADHTTAAADHTTAASDHTQATADHAVMAGYDTRLGNVEDEVSQLGQEIIEISGGNKPLVGWQTDVYIVNNQSVGSVCTKRVVEGQIGWKTILENIPTNVKKYIINGTGGSTPRLWCFLDENDVVLAISARDKTAANLELSVPSGATQLIINTNTNVDSYEVIEGDIPTIRQDIASLALDVATVESDVKDLEENADYHIDLHRDYNLINIVGMVWTPGFIKPNGVIVANDGYSVSDYIAIDANNGYIFLGLRTTAQYYDNESGQVVINSGNFLHNQYCCFFDKDKSVITTTISSDLSKPIPSNAAFIRVTAARSYRDYARLIYGNYDAGISSRFVDYRLLLPSSFKFPTTGYERLKMVAFGDSLTHGRFSEDTGKPSESWVDYANDELRSTIINCGFGGTRMMGDSLFSFISLCETIVSEAADKWDACDSYVVENPAFAYNLNVLKNVNWAEIDAVSIWYGANDYTNNSPIGQSYNEDKTCFDGACAKGIKLLQQKYPHLQILLISPIWGIRGGKDVDIETNGVNLTMPDYVNSLSRIPERRHCPLIDLYHTCQFNDLNKLVYSSDETHIRSLVGFKRLAHLLAEQIKLYISPKDI